MLGSTEDAEDVLQEVFAASFNAICADERPINARPWLYRIARNRCLNHLRRPAPAGQDSMDIFERDGGTTTADTVHKREEFRQIVSDVQDLPETQRTALLLREIDALAYDQIAEAMDTTVSSVKSLLVRARVSLAEASEARLLTCDEVRLELGQVAEGLGKTSAPARRHLRGCERCRTFKGELRKTNKALAAIYPLGPLVFLKKAIGAKLAAGGAGGAAAGGSGGAAALGGAAATAGAPAAISAGLGTVASKAAAGVAAAAHRDRRRRRGPPRDGLPGHQRAGSGDEGPGPRGAAARAGPHPRACRARRSSQSPSRRPSPRRSPPAPEPVAEPAAVAPKPVPVPEPKPAPVGQADRGGPGERVDRHAARRRRRQHRRRRAVLSPAARRPRRPQPAQPSAGPAAERPGQRAVGLPSRAIATFEDFEKLDLRVGRVLEVEDFPEARNPAWKLRIDFGPEVGEKRSSAQITHYPAEDLHGRMVIGVVNFPPRRIAGFKSEVLVLGALDDEHGVVLLRPDRDDVRPGDRIG